MADQGRLGKKANAGFYAYDDKGKRAGPVGRAGRGLSASATRSPTLTDVQHRLLFAQVLEAVRALEEGVLTDIREGDVGAILGWGFAPWSGGPFCWLDIIGAPRAVEICDALTATHGPRFHAPRCCATWRRRARPSTAASERPQGGLTAGVRRHARLPGRLRSLPRQRVRSRPSAVTASSKP